MTTDSYNEEISFAIDQICAGQETSPRERELSKFPPLLKKAEVALAAAHAVVDSLRRQQTEATEAARAERQLVKELTQRSEDLLAEEEKWEFCRLSEEDECRPLTGAAESCASLLAYFKNTPPSKWGSEARGRFPPLWFHKLQDDAIGIDSVDFILLRWQGIVVQMEGALADPSLWRARLVVRYESGQGSVYREGYVISPDGTIKQPETIKKNGKICGSRWFYLKEDLVLKWAKATVAAPHQYEVVSTPAFISELQRERTQKVLGEIDSHWSDRVGISGVCSPGAGLGWLLSDGSSLAWGEVSNHTPCASVSKESLSEKLSALKGRWERT